MDQQEQELLLTNSQEQFLCEDTFASFLKEVDNITDEGQFTRVLPREPQITYTDATTGNRFDIECSKFLFDVQDNGLPGFKTVTSESTINSGDLLGINNIGGYNDAVTPFDSWQQKNCSPTDDNEVPASNNWPGEYDFQVTFNSAMEKKTKGANWTYSKDLDMLYANIASPCPVLFHSLPLPNGHIRITTTFSRPEDSSEVVHRCPVHVLPSDPTNYGFIFPKHFLRVENTNAQYNTDSTTGHNSVVLPYKKPKDGTDFVTYVLKFMCLSSCAGSINRRPIQLIFTLESGGKCVGRRVIPLKVSKCPGRDIKTAERGLKNKSKKPDEETTNAQPEEKKTETRTLMTKTTSQEFISIDPGPKRIRLCDDSDEGFILRIKKREHFEILRRVKQSLELADKVPADVKQEYEAEERATAIGPFQTKSIKAAPNETEIKSEPNISLLSWLENIDMEGYYDMFIDAGVTDAHQLNSISRETLRYMGIGEGHQQILWSAIQKRSCPEPAKTISLSQGSQQSISLSQGSNSMVNRRIMLTRFKITHQASIASDHDYLKK